MPLLLNREFSINFRLSLLNVINIALLDDGVSELIEENQLGQTFIDTFFLFSTELYHPDDSIELSWIDIFDFMVNSFSENENLTKLFLTTIFQNLNEETTRPGAILCLAHFFNSDSESFLNDLDSIVNLLIECAANPIVLVRSCAITAIDVFIEEFFEEIDDYFSILSTTLISLIPTESAQSAILALKNLFEAATSTDSIFEQAFPFLLNLLTDTSSSEIHVVFPCTLR